MCEKSIGILCWPRVCSRSNIQMMFAKALIKSTCVMFAIIPAVALL